ncbi:MAG: hypothetical protein Q9188_001981 [Gyalolechia gomerana]
MASSEPGNRKRKIHHLLDLSDEEEERLGPPQLRCKRRLKPACSHAQHTPTELGDSAQDTIASPSQISPRHPPPATEPIITTIEPSLECSPTDHPDCIPDPGILPSPQYQTSHWLPPAVFEPGILPSPRYQISQWLPPDRAAEPITTSGEDTGACIPSIEHQPTQERSPSATQPEPSPHESRHSSASETPPRTPFEFVYTNLFDEDFGRKVCEAYLESKWREAGRAFRYGKSVAQEWKRGSTPEEAREAWKAKLEEDERSWYAMSPTPELEDEQYVQHEQHEPQSYAVTGPGALGSQQSIIAT